MCGFKAAVKARRALSGPRQWGLSEGVGLPAPLVSEGLKRRLGALERAEVSLPGAFARGPFWGFSGGWPGCVV